MRSNSFVLSDRRQLTALGAEADQAAEAGPASTHESPRTRISDLITDKRAGPPEHCQCASGSVITEPRWATRDRAIFSEIDDRSYRWTAEGPGTSLRAAAVRTEAADAAPPARCRELWYRQTRVFASGSARRGCVMDFVRQRIPDEGSGRARPKSTKTNQDSPA